MPKKRQHVRSFKPSPLASASDKPRSPATSVNQRLANLRIATADPSTSGLPLAPTPSLPPAIREILHQPETPALPPRRPVRRRFDEHGRRLPAGPAPPRSWTSRDISGASGAGATATAAGVERQACESLPGTYVPHHGSLVDLVVARLALNWDFHRVYDQDYLYFMPDHLKHHLIRNIGLVAEFGVSVDDLKAILLPPVDSSLAPSTESGASDYAVSNSHVSCLDLAGSIGCSLDLRQLSHLLFPQGVHAASGEPQESWSALDASPSPPQVLLPGLTHLSLALTSRDSQQRASWRQFLSLSAKLSTVTHLSLAFWPVPCFNPAAKCVTVTDAHGRSVPSSGTHYYSHTLDDDWAEALRILRLLSRNLYRLECLDLTGCAPWFKPLLLKDGPDFIDWASDWGGVKLLRLRVGWTLGQEAQPSERIAHQRAVETAAKVERHIVAQRAGRGSFITVERDRLDG